MNGSGVSSSDGKSGCRTSLWWRQAAEECLNVYVLSSIFSIS